MTVQPDSTMTVQPDSTVTVQPDSTVTVQPDSTVTIQPDSTVTVQPDSTITVQPDSTVTVHSSSMQSTRYSFQIWIKLAISWQILAKYSSINFQKISPVWADRQTDGCSVRTDRRTVVQCEQTDGQLFSANRQMDGCSVRTDRWTVVQCEQTDGRLFSANRQTDGCSVGTDRRMDIRDITVAVRNLMSVLVSDVLFYIYYFIITYWLLDIDYW